MMDGSRYSDLESVLDISSATLSNRLDEACELHLMELTLDSTDYGTNKRYELTKPGRRLRSEMERRGIMRTYHRIRELEEQLDASMAGLNEWVAKDLYRREKPTFDPDLDPDFEP